MTRESATTMVLCIAAGLAAVSAGGSEPEPCPGTRAAPLQESASRSGKAQSTVARSGAAPSAGKTAANRIYELDAQAGKINFGDGEAGRRPPGAATTGNRSGAGSSGNVDPSRCR
jgi:hypothetical protein